MGEVAPAEFTEALAAFATGVVVVTVRDGRDDIGTTLTAFGSVSLDPPMVLIGVGTGSYLGEVLQRCDRWAVTVLSAAQRVIAGRFAAAGRPSARLLIAGEPHHRGADSGALVIEGGSAALECETRQRVPAGDHVLFIAEVLAIDYVDAGRPPLIRVNRRYR
ncbi:flavin reductase family protein [Actinoallomurus sp. WRP6H-15]|nr:flavin reductase family protein [Actinoallomurus soli]MCO5970840.1 flavin reductase family protein [Actinoallomurus soli]